MKDNFLNEAQKGSLEENHGESELNDKKIVPNKGGGEKEEVYEENLHLLFIFQHGLNGSAQSMSHLAEIVSKRFEEKKIKFSTVKKKKKKKFKKI